MADIAEINNGESGSSVRVKLNSLVNKTNSDGELAYKISSPTDIQQLEYLKVNSEGQYTGFSLYRASTLAELKTLLADSTVYYIEVDGAISITEDIVISGTKVINGSGIITIGANINIINSTASSVTLSIECVLAGSDDYTVTYDNASYNLTLRLKYARNITSSKTLTFNSTNTAYIILDYQNIDTKLTLDIAGTTIRTLRDYTLPISNSIFNCRTVANAALLGSVYGFISVDETGKIYKYISTGSSYTVDNNNVLATVDGGNTRFVDINYSDSSIIVTSSAELYAALALDGDRIIQLNYSGNFLFVGAATCVLGSGTKTITGSHKIIFANENIFSASAANTMILFDCKCMMNGGVELTQTGSYDITLSFKDCKTASSNIGNVTVNSDVTAYVANSKEIEWFNGGGTLTFNDEFFISSNLMLVKENVTADITETDWFPEGYLLESIIVEETAGQSAESLKIAASTSSDIIYISNTIANYTSFLTMLDNSYFYSGYRDLLIQASSWNSASFTFKFNLKRV